jgi:DNA-binding transcriptional ArsR family regulator
MDIAPTTHCEYVPPLLDRFADPGVAETAAAREGTCAGDERAVTALLRLLSDPLRLKLLRLLVGREQSVTELYRATAVPQPTVSHHLASLRAGQLVVRRRSGKNVFYALGPAVVADARGLSVGNVRIRMHGEG